MKSKYEISIWSDEFDSELNRLVEKKIIVIGSDTMTSQARAREPKLVNNINGTNKFSFTLYYSYIDTITGEKVSNPYIPFLVNERKIKVFWKDEWYDFLIKQIKEDSVNHVFTYICEDQYITELSRTGFELEFNTELENNIGTARELVEKTLENTDWQFNEDLSDTIYQETEEPVYEVQVLKDFKAYQEPGGNLVTISKDKPILIYYSMASNITQGAQALVQFYYNGTDIWQQDENDMLVINGNCYHIDVTWRISNNIATASHLIYGNIFEVDLSNGVSNKYRAKRYVQSQKTIFNNIVNRYVNVYKDTSGEKLLGYQTTEYNDALAVVNLVTNPSNFSNISGWVGSELYFKISPAFDENTVIASYEATSFLYLKKGTYFNTGIQNNRPYIKNGFIEGEHYVFRIKVKANGGEPASQDYITNPNLIIPSIQSRNMDYEPAGTNYFSITSEIYDDSEHWLEYDMICIKSCSYDKILSSSDPFGIFITTNVNCWLEEAQFFREVFGNTGYNDESLIRINPGKMSLQSIAQTYWKYFLADQPSDVTKDTLQYKYISINEWDGAIPVYNNYERYGTIEIAKSNRFNILQAIAETFQCWVRFKVEHDSQGNIIYENGQLHKWVYLKREVGEETGIGFIYGIDLKGIIRNLKSDKISTKTIVQQNDNEFGKNGFCSIARSIQNYTRENTIYNFDYYIQQGLLDWNILYYDLYSATGINYYNKLHNLNAKYAKNLDDLINKKSELTKQEAMSTVYGQYIISSIEELQEVESSIMKLAGVTNFEAAGGYAKSHAKDNKVQSLMDDRSQIKKTINAYQSLHNELQISLERLHQYINSIEDEQEDIISQLRSLNKEFYTKYSRYIQEGTWTSENYWNDDLYYLDAVQVAYTSSRPQITYEINVLRLSDLEDFSSKVFKLGDISFVQDVKYFGYKLDKITPFKEKVILTEITSYFDTPDKDIIKVQNYKTQFDDLFQRITAATQNLEFNEGKYAKAANIVSVDGTIKSSVIQNTFDSNKDLVYGAQNESATIDNTGITVTDNGNAARQVKITSGGIFVTNDAGVTWKNAIRGDGISTDLLTAGRINTEEITVYNGEYPSFRWDPNGLNAYKFTENGVDTTQFVRFDQFGIYGRKNAPAVWEPESEKDIYDNSQFGLTWNKFFMKSSNGNKSIEISTDKDIVVNDGNYNRIIIGRVDYPDEDNYGIKIQNNIGDTIFQCDNEGSFLSGWTLNADFLESTISTTTNNNIRIYSDGNIGCYGHESLNVSEPAYTTTTKVAFSAIDMNTNKKVNIASDKEIYPFVSSIGKTKVQYAAKGAKQKKYEQVPAGLAPQPPSTIQFVYKNNNKNYTVSGITWVVTQSSYEANEVKEGSTVLYTLYTYKFNLQAKIGNKTIFTILYNEEYTNKNRYVPASDTKWKIDNNGDAVFHEILADGGSIAGWWIDNESIYQTYDGTRNKTRKVNNKTVTNIKTELNSNGTATVANFDYSIVTDAINAAMANIGGVLMSSGLINGYNIAQVAQAAAAAQNAAAAAQSTANSALSLAQTAYNNANYAVNHLAHSHSGGGSADLETGAVSIWISRYSPD